MADLGFTPGTTRRGFAAASDRFGWNLKLRDRIDLPATALFAPVSSTAFARPMAPVK